MQLTKWAGKVPYLLLLKCSMLWFIVIHELFHKYNSLPLDRYEPSSPSTKELHGCCNYCRVTRFGKFRHFGKIFKILDNF